MNISPALSIVLESLQIVSAIWVLIFGGKGLIEMIRTPPPPGTPSSLPAGPLATIFRKVKKIKRSTLLNVILAIVVLVASSLVLVFFNQPCSPFAPTSVTITSPASESKVPRFITVQGTACHIPNGEQLWVLIAVDGVTGYFPQPGPVSVGYDGKWFSRVTLGIDADRGKKFEINAVLVDKDGRTAIDRYFMQPPNPNYIGINSLQGITIMGTVNVIRT